MKSVVHEVYITCMMYIVEEQKQASASRYFKGFIRKKTCNGSFTKYKSKHKQNQIQDCGETGTN